MAKVTLGAAPKNFKRTVAFLTVEGAAGEIEAVFKYRTRKEFAEFVDKIYADANEKPPADGKFSVVDLMARGTAKVGEHLVGILESWDLADELTPANAERLADEFPGAAAALLEDYRTLCTEGRAKN